MSVSYNCQSTLEFQRELTNAIGHQRYRRLTYIWVSSTGERYVSWDRIRDEGCGVWFGASLTIAEIASQLMSLLG